MTYRQEMGDQLVVKYLSLTLWTQVNHSLILHLYARISLHKLSSLIYSAQGTLYQSFLDQLL